MASSFWSPNMNELRITQIVGAFICVMMLLNFYFIIGVFKSQFKINQLDQTKILELQDRIRALENK
jgi:uncharacterized membrane protein